MTSVQCPVPNVPEVISPSPTLPDVSEASRDTYFPPVTRSTAKRSYTSTDAVVAAPKDGHDAAADALLDQRARARSRSPVLATAGPGYDARRRFSGLSPANLGLTQKIKPEPRARENLSQPPQVNGDLSPYSYSTIRNRWREFSRSPSPLGLIPLHRHYRFIHKHEIPRKILHIGVGFLTLSFYIHGVQTSTITPWLLSALVPVAAADYLRHRSQSFNRIYIKCLGALMRETEVDGWNGVVWYLLGAYTALRFFPKDVGVMSVLLLSWCDTAASTFGRLYGRYTIRLRKGKTLAGTTAAFVTGLSTAMMFWGWLAPRTGTFPDDPADGFLFTGTLGLPRAIGGYVGRKGAEMTINGAVALGVMSGWTGFVVAFSEFVDILGWDDNFTIPVLSGLGLWGFLKTFRA